MVLMPVAVLGIVALAFVLGLTVLLPAYAIISFVDGKHVVALVVVALWLIWLRFARPVCRFVFEGFEHGSL